MNKKIWLSSPHMSDHELEFVKEAFASNWIAPLGPNIEGFESDIANFINIENVTALSSGTSAIHLALIILDTQPGDEVICQSFTFSATANPILYLGAKPIFVDSEPETWNMSPLYLRRAIEDRLKLGKKPKAIIPVHLYGMPAKCKEILAISKEFDIPIVEDAAEALGSTYYGKACGTFGKIGVLSFNGNKIITTSGGGALVSEDPEITKKAKFLATQARDPAPHYQHSQVGYNYRMSNVCAGIGRGQMMVIDERIASRRNNFDIYSQSFKSLTGITFQNEPLNCESNRWLTCMILDPSCIKSTPGKVMEYLESFNIETRHLWKPLHLQPLFNGYPYYGEDVSENLFNNGLCLPSGSNLDVEEVRKVAKLIKNFLS